MDFSLKEVVWDSEDLHVHCGPEALLRRVDGFDVLDYVRKFHMKAVVIKSHHAITTDWAYLAHKYLRCKSIRAYGSVTRARNQCARLDQKKETKWPKRKLTC